MNQVEERQALPNGEQIGVYEIKGLKHIGPSAILYRVKNEHMNAVEVLVEYFPGDVVRRAQDGNTVECLSESQGTIFNRGLKRFLEQAERLSEIEHPNIAQVYNTLQFNGTGYLVMDNEQGTPLIKLLEASTTFGQTELEFLLATLLDAIRQAHEKGIVHGDIHPSHILIKKNGEPVLTNFVANRLAAALDYGNPGNYLRLNYAAPELFESGYSPKPAADIYALGATIYRCMTLTDPLPPSERISATAKGQADPVKAAFESISGDYSEQFLNTVLRMLEPSEDQRLQTADAVLSVLGVSGQESVASEPSQSAQQSDAPVSKSSKTLWLGAAAVIMLIAFVLWSSGTNDKQPVSKTADSGKELAEAIREKKPTVPESPKGEAEVLTIKTEEPGVSRAPAENHSETVTAAVAEASVPVKEPPPVPEQSTEMAAESQTNAEAFGSAKSTSQASSPPTTGNDEKLAAIKDHLVAAEAALTAFRLSTPADDNAYSHYQAVLELDSENTAAKEGIQHIVDRYAWLIDRAIKSENYGKAKVYLDRAKLIKPDDAALKELGKALKEASR